jgi:uncharacterized protein (DUF885 family)
MTAVDGKQWRALVEALLDEYFARYPGTAAHLGFHAYDGQVTDFSAAAIAAWSARVAHYQAELAAVDPAGLSLEDRLDWEVLRAALEQEVFQWKELAEWRRNPMAYLWSIDTSSYLKRDYAPLPVRAQAVARQLAEIPRVLAQGKENLQPPLPVTFVETSLDMFRGTARFIEQELPAAVQAVGPGHEALLERLESARLAALAAVEDFVRFLEGQRSGATTAFAIGAEHFRRMLWTGERVDVPLERLLEIGEADLARNRRAFEALARQLDPALSPADVMARLGHHHPTREALVQETRDMLEELRSWVIARDLVTVPSEVRIRVEETPSFLRWAFAMMDSPGAFEEVAEESFYYVTPPEDHWPPEQQEEWLTKFDYATLRDVSIHEAYPGHYIHFLHTKGVPSKVRRIFGAYSFWEAWAHYVEQLMIEQGFRPEDRELRLAQLSEALLRNVRYIVAIKMHTQGMTVDEATAMFAEQAYLAAKPARQEAVRGTFDPGYLNYTLGKLMLLKLREDVRAREGESFDLQSFHDRFLSYGAPPVPLVRWAMLGENGAIL